MYLWLLLSSTPVRCGTSSVAGACRVSTRMSQCLRRFCFAQDSFGVEELVAALRLLPRDVPLSSNQLDFATNLVRLLATGGVVVDAAADGDGGSGRRRGRSDESDSEYEAADGDEPDADTSRGSSDAGAVHDTVPSTSASAAAGEGGGVASGQWRLQVEAAGEIYCPDSSGCMRLSTALLYNDASFLPQHLINKYQHMLVHAKVQREWARAVRVRSLRNVVLSDEASTEVCDAGALHCDDYVSRHLNCSSTSSAHLNYHCDHSRHHHNHGDNTAPATATATTTTTPIIASTPPALCSMASSRRSPFACVAPTVPVVCFADAAMSVADGGGAVP